MFEKKRKPGENLPPIDITQKAVRDASGKIKYVPTTNREQKILKEKIMKKRSGLHFADGLRDRKPSGPKDDLAWIDELEMIDAIFND